MHELLHATGHPKRLNRATVNDFSPSASVLEEATTRAALRTVLVAVGSPEEAVQWQTDLDKLPPVDLDAAELAADWMLSDRATDSFRSSVRGIITSISCVMKYGARYGHVFGNPCRDVNLPSAKRTSEPRYLEHHEVRAILDKLGTSSNQSRRRATSRRCASPRPFL